MLTGEGSTLISNANIFLSPVELPMSTMNTLVIKLAQIEERLAKGCTEVVQTAALLAAFAICRDMVAMEK